MAERESVEIPFLNNPLSIKFFTLCDSLREKNKYRAGDGDPPCALICGESGFGKTGLAKKYLKMNPVIHGETRTHIPVFYIRIREASTTKSVLKKGIKEIIKLTGCENPDKVYKDRIKGQTDKDDLTDCLLTQIKSAGVELILIDEIQVIIQRRSKDVIKGIADTFKDLIEEGDVPIVFMGTPWGKHLIESNNQLSERVENEITIEPFRISKKEYRNEYRLALKILATRMGYPKEFKLQKYEFMLRMYSYTDGNLRRTVRLIREVYVNWLLDGGEIDVNSFANVLKVRKSIRNADNPFLKPLDKLVLRELVSYSDYAAGQKGGKSPIIAAEYVSYCVTEKMEVRRLAYG